MSGFTLRRLGLVMEPEPGNPQEVEGVLNPAAVRGPDGNLYLFPRLVPRGNFRASASPACSSTSPATRQAWSGSALPWSRKRTTSVGPMAAVAADPRITFVEPLQRYVMTYAEFSPIGPRIALAISEDWPWTHWDWQPLLPIAASISCMWTTRMPASSRWPSPITPANCSLPCSTDRCFPARVPRKPPAMRPPGWWISIESIWISYCPMALPDRPSPHLGLFNSHHRLAAPVAPGSGSKLAAAHRPSSPGMAG